MGALKRLSNLVTRPLTAYNNAAKKQPFAVGVWTTVFKTSAADIFAQKVIERREEIDWRRNGVFSIFGFAYLGCWQYYLYAKVFTRMTPTIQSYFGARSVGPILTFLDQAVHHPIMYFPAFYLLRGAMTGEEPSSSLAKYRSEAWDNLKALWMVWVPAQLVNFSVVPLHLRVPFVAGVSFAWCVILSVLRGALGPAQQRVRKELHHIEEGMHAVGDKIHALGDRMQHASDGHQGMGERMHHTSERMHLRDAVPLALADSGQGGLEEGASQRQRSAPATAAAASVAEQRQVKLDAHGA